MPLNTNNLDTQTDLKDDLMDTSIDDAKWLLGGVAMLGFIVAALGLFASTLAV